MTAPGPAAASARGAGTDLDEAFERMASAGFELPNGFVNHGAMACEALDALGFEGELGEWAKRFARIAGPAVTPRAGSIPRLARVSGRLQSTARVDRPFRNGDRRRRVGRGRRGLGAPPRPGDGNGAISRGDPGGPRGAGHPGVRHLGPTRRTGTGARLLGRATGPARSRPARALATWTPWSKRTACSKRTVCSKRTCAASGPGRSGRCCPLLLGLAEHLFPPWGDRRHGNRASRSSSFRPRPAPPPWPSWKPSTARCTPAPAMWQRSESRAPPPSPGDGSRSQRRPA